MTTYRGYINKAKPKRIFIPGLDKYTRSKREATMAKELLAMRDAGVFLSVEYEPLRFTFLKKNGQQMGGVNAHYVPDFRVRFAENLHGYDMAWIECKGYMDRNSMIRLKRFLLQEVHPSGAVLFINTAKNEYARLVQYLSKLPNEVRQCCRQW